MRLFAFFLIFSMGVAAMPDNSVIVLSPPLGYSALWVTDVSDDGSAAVGYVVSSDSSYSRAFRWTRNLGVAVLDAAGSSWAQGVSHDGSLVVGSAGSGSQQTAVSWDAQGNRSLLHPDFRRATAVTPDGRYSVGRTTRGFACRFGDGRLEQLEDDYFSVAYCTTPSGATVAGGTIAWRWDEGVGFQLVIPSWGPGQAVTSISDDGTVLGGYFNSAFDRKAFLLRNGQPSRYYEDLGIYEVTALSGDGQVVVSSGFDGGSWIGFADGVPEPFRGYLERIGTTGLEEWSNFYAVAVSRDARFAAGNGRYQGVISGWVFSGSLRPGIRRATARPARSAQEPR